MVFELICVTVLSLRMHYEVVKVQTNLGSQHPCC